MTIGVLPFTSSGSTSAPGETKETDLETDLVRKAHAPKERFLGCLRSGRTTEGQLALATPLSDKPTLVIRPWHQSGNVV